MGSKVAALQSVVAVAFLMSSCSPEKRDMKSRPSDTDENLLGYLDSVETTVKRSGGEVAIGTSRFSFPENWSNQDYKVRLKKVDSATAFETTHGVSLGSPFGDVIEVSIFDETTGILASSSSLTSRFTIFQEIKTGFVDEQLSMAAVTDPGTAGSKLVVLPRSELTIAAASETSNLASIQLGLTHGVIWLVQISPEQSGTVPISTSADLVSDGGGVVAATVSTQPPGEDPSHLSSESGSILGLHESAWNLPVISEDLVAGGNRTWSNASNARLADGSLAEVELYDGRDSTSLQLTGYFTGSNAIPNGAKPGSLEFRCMIGEMQSGPRSRVSELKIVKNSTLIGASLFGFADGIVIDQLPALKTIFSSDAGNLGHGRLTPEDINSSTFGARIKVADDWETGNTHFLGIDYCQMRASYETRELFAYPLSASTIKVSYPAIWSSGVNLTLQRRPFGGDWSDLATLSTGGGVFSDTGVSSLTEYDYRIRSVIGNSDERFTDIATAVTDWGGSGSFDETFDRGLIDYIWNPTNSYVAFSQGKLQLSFPPITNSTAIYGGIVSRFQINGDFDAAVSFSGVSTNCHGGPKAGINIWTPNGYVWLFKSSVEINSNNNGVTGPSGEGESASGILRLKRVGATYTAYDEDGTTAIGSWNGPTGATAIGLYGTSNQNSCTFNITFENFQLR
jgi:hypothetical protein